MIRFFAVSNIPPAPVVTEAQAHVVTVMFPFIERLILLAGIVHCGIPLKSVDDILKFHPVAPCKSLHPKSGPIHAFPDKDLITGPAIVPPRLSPVADVQSEIPHATIDNDN